MLDSTLVLFQEGKWARKNAFSPWPSIKRIAHDIEKKLMGLPSCSIWLHKKVLHKHCKAPEGASFGQRKSFHCVTTGISKGFIGNRKGPDFLVMNNSIPGFGMEGVSASQIKFQYYGRKELFSNGHLCKPTYSRPRYFSTGGVS